MGNEEDIPDVWQDIDQLIEDQACIVEKNEGQSPPLTLIASAECNLELMNQRASAKKPLAVPIQRFILQGGDDVEEEAIPSLRASLGSVIFSPEDWVRYVEGRDVQFFSSRKIPVVIYKHIGDDRILYGFGYASEDSLLITSNFH